MLLTEPTFTDESRVQANTPTHTLTEQIHTSTTMLINPDTFHPLLH